ncbi:hypothetical protein ABT304_21075 [Nocardioides sp. NPDC000445]|uniref:hypothetical protein n=1 Tax=Nocardioides sp. NPDC000445 TaxID=3154257 RepID=UPI003317D9CF
MRGREVWVGHKGTLGAPPSYAGTIRPQQLRVAYCNRWAAYARGVLARVLIGDLGIRPMYSAPSGAWAMLPARLDELRAEAARRGIPCEVVEHEHLRSLARRERDEKNAEAAVLKAEERGQLW